MTALQVLQVLSKSRRLTTKEFNEELPAYKFWRRRCLVLCDCKPALQQIENAHRKGMPEGLRDWERGGLLEAIAHYRSKLEAVVFVWAGLPSHVGIACNAYDDAVATAYLSERTTRRTPRRWFGTRCELGRACTSEKGGGREPSFLFLVNRDPTRKPHLPRLLHLPLLLTYAFGRRASFTHAMSADEMRERRHVDARGVTRRAAPPALSGSLRAGCARRARPPRGSRARGPRAATRTRGSPKSGRAAAAAGRRRGGRRSAPRT